MFEVSLLDSLLLVVGLALFAVAIATATLVLRQGRRVDRLARELHAERRAREELARDLGALLACSREIGSHVRAQDRRQKAVMERVEEIADAMEEAPALKHVERLLEDGLGVEQIRRVCELSQGEARLLERWKQQRRVA